MSLKTFIAQLAVEAGHLNENFKQMSELIAQAKKEQAELIVFPELCVSGSCVGDKWYKGEFLRDLEKYNEQITALSEGIAVVWGNVIEQEGKLYNAALCALDKQIIHVECKKRLCDDGISSEHRWFTAGEASSEGLMLNGNRIQFVIGSEEFDDAKEYDLVIHVDSSAWSLEDEGAYDAKMEKLSLKKVIHVQFAGVQNTGKNVVRLYASNSSRSGSNTSYVMFSYNLFIPVFYDETNPFAMEIVKGENEVLYNGGIEINSNNNATYNLERRNELWGDYKYSTIKNLIVRVNSPESESNTSIALNFYNFI